MGRPPVPKEERTVQTSIALRRKDVAALRRFARKRGVSVSRVVQDALARFMGAEEGR
jgi:hypothetical protein